MDLILSLIGVFGSLGLISFIVRFYRNLMIQKQDVVRKSLANAEVKIENDIKSLDLTGLADRANGNGSKSSGTKEGK